jgi:hypothetical protein
MSSRGAQRRSNKMVFSQRTRIATFTWGSAYLMDSKIFAVLEKDQAYNKSEVKKVAADLGLVILPEFRSIRQRGTKGFVYKTAPVNA